MAALVRFRLGGLRLVRSSGVGVGGGGGGGGGCGGGGGGGGRALSRSLRRSSSSAPPPPPLPLLLLLHSEASALHDPGAGHPEQPARIAAAVGAVRQGLAAEEAAGQVEWREVGAGAGRATGNDLLLAHSAAHVATLNSAFDTLRRFEGLGPLSEHSSDPSFGVEGGDSERQPIVRFDADTVAGVGTEAAVLDAVGAAIGIPLRIPAVHSLSHPCC